MRFIQITITIALVLSGLTSLAQNNLYDSLITSGRTQSVSANLQRLVLNENITKFHYVFGFEINRIKEIRVAYFGFETHPTPYDKIEFLGTFDEQGNLIHKISKLNTGDYHSSFKINNVQNNIYELKTENISILDSVYKSDFYRDMDETLKMTEISGTEYIIQNAPKKFIIFESKQSYYHISSTGFIRPLDRYISTEFNRKYSFTSLRELTRDELINYSKSELRVIRNEIFAKYGYIFKSDDLTNYFLNNNWYKPLYDDVNIFLTQIEKENIKLIQKLEREK